MYLKKGKAKVEIAIAKGKKLTIKEQLRKRDWDREKARIFSKSQIMIFLGIGQIYHQTLEIDLRILI